MQATVNDKRSGLWNSILAAVLSGAVASTASSIITTRVIETKVDGLEEAVKALQKDSTENGKTLVGVKTTFDEALRPQLLVHERRVSALEAQIISTQQQLAQAIGVMSQVQSSMEAILRAMGQWPPPPSPPSRPR